MRVTATKKDEQTLREARTRVEAILRQLAGATAERDEAARRVAGREHALRVGIARLNPGDNDAVAHLALERTQLELLTQWVSSAPKVHAALAELRAAMQAAAAAIRDTAQPRSVEEGAAFLCLWLPSLDRPAEIVVEEQARFLRDLAAGVQRDLDTVLAARRGAILDEAERRSGFLRAGSSVVRPLSLQERRDGVAHE